jgi:ABC-type transporter Mla subunit MlaD
LFTRNGTLPCDFSSGTISNLLKQGIDDALNTLVKEAKDIQAAYDQIDAFINEIKKQNTDLIEAAENIKTILDQLK